MKVLDLRCEYGHAFEGWFGSESDFADQLSRQLIACPMCGSVQLNKLPSAPRLNLLSPQQDMASGSAPAGGGDRSVQPAQARGGEGRRQDDGNAKPTVPTSAGALAAAVLHHVLTRTEDVGSRFADEARRMHYGEAEERGIRGQATLSDVKALQDEGIDVLALPVLSGPKEPSH